MFYEELQPLRALEDINYKAACAFESNNGAEDVKGYPLLLHLIAHPGRLLLLLLVLLHLPRPSPCANLLVS